MSEEAAPGTVATTSPTGATPRERDLSLVPSLSSEDRPFFPVSMVVHGGTGILHGNMTSLTVNQYIGVVPDRGAWDSGKVRELMSDVVKVGTEANNQLSYQEPSASYPKSGFPGNLLKKKGNRNGWWLVLAGLVLLCIVPLGTLAMYTKFFSPAPKDLLEPKMTPSITPPSTNLENYSVNPATKENAPRIFSRSHWLAQPPRRPIENNTLPIHMVVVADTRTEECSTAAECVSQVRNQQLYDMDSRRFDDIGYNFLIGGDGNVYSGRGWDAVGAHTKGYNVGTLGVALIGSFSQTLPKEVQVKAFEQLVETGVEINKILPNYTLVNHCQLRTDGFYDLALATNMKSWPHFDRSFPISRCALP